MKYITTLLLIIGLCLAVFLIKNTGPSTIMNALTQSEVALIFIGLLIFIFSILIRAMKWNILVNITSSRKIPFMQLVPVCLFNNMISYFTPARSGDVMAPMLLRRRLDTFVGSGFSVVIIDRLIEAACLFMGMFAAGIYFFYATQSRDSLFNFFMYALMLCLTVFAAAAVVFMSKKACNAVLIWAEGKKLPDFFGRFFAFIRREGNFFFAGAKKIGFQDIFFKLFPLTILAWSCDMFAVFCFFSSVMAIDFIHLTMTLFLSSGIAIASFIPGGFGSGELSQYYLLKNMGYPSSSLMAGILVARFIPLALILVSGFISFFIIKKST